MRFSETSLPGAFVIDLEPIADERGFFARAWSARELAERDLDTRVAHCNMAFNERAGTLRGMHYQAAPHGETKLVRCTRGRVYDVIVDLRGDSPTHAQWIGIELSEANRRMLYVPEGFAHGYQTLEDGSETFYIVSAEYAADAQRGVRWDDPAFAIEWPDAPSRIISEKDRSWPDYVRSRSA